MVRLEIVLILTQDRCAVCTEHTIGKEIVLDALDVTLRLVAHVECHFGPFGNNVSVSAR